LRSRAVGKIENADLIFIDLDTHQQRLWPGYAGNGPKLTSLSQTQKCELDEEEASIQIIYDTIVDTMKSYQLSKNQKFVVFYSVRSSFSVAKGPDRREVYTSFSKLPVIFVGNSVVNVDSDARPSLQLLDPILDAMKLDMQPHPRIQRNIFASFVGRVHTNKPLRGALMNLRSKTGQNLYLQDADKTLQDKERVLNYRDVLLNSEFMLAPRGDNHYSFRPSEALVYGAIPVIYDDRAAIPYVNSTFDARSWGVIIPEAQAKDTLEILSRISSKDRQRYIEGGQNARKCAETVEGNVDCMLAGLAMFT